MFKVTSYIAVFAFCMSLVATDANAIAGGRLKSESKSPVKAATRYYERGLKASSKAGELEVKAEEARSESKKTSTLAKAEKQHNKAIRLYRKAIEIFPDLSKVYTDLGYSLMKTGQFDAALAALDEALSRNSEDEKAQTYRAEVLTVREMQGAQAQREEESSGSMLNVSAGH